MRIMFGLTRQASFYSFRTGTATRCAAVMALCLLASCRDAVYPGDNNSDWTEASHGLVAPNYSVVFPQDSVNKIEIVITAQQWAGMRQNMSTLWGFDFGSHKAGPCCCPCPVDEPRYIDVPVRFNGRLWKHVGFRLKGNSSLEVPWDQGIYKLPFRLKFDEFEDKYADVGDQRFYGFKEVTMSTALFDQSLIRDKLASDIFRMAGVPAARTAFYRVYIDFGQGLKYVGVYTMVELIEDTMLKNQFGEDAGNAYKPRSNLQTFVQSEFPKQNNKAAANYSDVQALVTALHSSVRNGNPAQWRTSLEAVFDVNQFLKWLAVNNAIVSWDSYGTNAQNFYLYNHSVRKLTWIPWDQNYALMGNPGIAGAVPRQYVGGVGLSLRMNEVDGAWPLIRYLADDPVYNERYRGFLRAFSTGVFRQATMDALFDKYHTMVSPYAVGPGGEQPGATNLAGSEHFIESLPMLKQHVETRSQLIADFLR